MHVQELLAQAHVRGLEVYPVGSGMTGHSVAGWDRRRTPVHRHSPGAPQVADADPAANPPALVEVVVTVRAVNRPASFHGVPPWSCR